jgi:CelD/BcsL family acetyltransferase involved in cellulose biosynthesis
MITITVIRTTDEFARLHDEWNTLLAASAADCVFLTHEWLFTWWKHLADGRELTIVTARDGGKLVGILPLARRTAQYARMMPRVAEFLGSGVIGSDYLDAIIAKGCEETVLDEFARELNSWGLMLQLNQLRAGKCIVGNLPHVLAQRHWIASETKINICPFIDLKNHTWETYLASLSSSQRYSFNRKVRSLEKNFSVRLDVIETESGASRGLDTVIELHHKRWSSRGASEAFQTDEFTAFHREFVGLAAKHGWLRLIIVNLDDVPRAAIYGLRYGPTFYFYQSGFDPDYSKQSVGLVVMGLAIKQAIDEGASEYDLLHGEEEYKFHWARDQRNLGRIELYPPHACGRVYKRAIHFNRAARRMVKRMLYKP